MIVSVITDSDNDTEIVVTCPDCGATEWFDPRPWHHCIDCMAVRANGFIHKCTECGCDKPAIGARVNPYDGSTEREDITKWVNICTTVEKEIYEKLKHLDPIDPAICKVLGRHHEDTRS